MKTGATPKPLAFDGPGTALKGITARLTKAGHQSFAYLRKGARRGRKAGRRQDHV